MMPSAFEGQAVTAPSELAASWAADPCQSTATASPPQHPNVFVRGLPLTWNEAEMTAVFQQYGQLSSLRLARHSITKQSLGYGFVRFQEPGEAQLAINALDGTNVLGSVLHVKFADSDAGPPSSGALTGLSPSDSCYVKHLPLTYGAPEVQALFEAHGAVVDVKLFQCADQSRGGSALVRMASVEAAARAIDGLNNCVPSGGVRSLLVRFAESHAEKAARLARREQRQQLQQLAPALAVSGSLRNMDPFQMQQALAAMSLGAFGTQQGAPPPLPTLAAASRAASLPQPLQAPPPVAHGYQPAPTSSICVKGVPDTADRLWVYETFARFGAVVGMRILIDAGTGLCAGTAFVNFADPLAAERAKQATNGLRAADKILHVSVQQVQGRGGGRIHGGGTSIAGGVGVQQQQQQQQQVALAEWDALMQQANATDW